MTLSRRPPAASPAVASSSATSLALTAVSPADLDSWIANNSALIIDIRPHGAHSSARVPRAVSLSVPSTLLKRPNFPLQRLADMIGSPTNRNHFSAWRSASRILVYDADSLTVGDSSNVAGLLRKFSVSGFQGELAWISGGFQAVWRERREIVDTQQPGSENDDEDDEPDKHPPSNVLRTRHLPRAAFSLSSTTVHNSPHFNPPAAAPPSKRPPTLQTRLPSSTATNTSHPAFNPFFDTVRQNHELSHGITERIPLQLPRRVRRRMQDLPFPWLQQIARRASKAPPRHKTLSDSSSSESEDDDASSVLVEEGKEALAMQFFKVELAEQRRLMGIMEHHSKETTHQNGVCEFPVPFPYSITAGVEKGAKNRYRHIWPFEHARVRLHQKKHHDDDYVNASYVQPLGTNRRYIATQGPLPATFTDFWTLCWEQNVHVIVMLTREVEGAMVKCGAYWTDTVFGPLRLRLISTEGLAPPDERPITAGFFPSHSSSLSVHPSRASTRRFPLSAGSERPYRHHYRTNRSETVKRTFELSHTGYPDAKPRQIIHLQYLEWPDMNVPDDPRGVLGLIKQVEEAARDTQSVQSTEPRKRRPEKERLDEVDEKTGIAKHALANSPVLLHCSAGVGRTGGFIAVDAILDAIRREVRANLNAASPRKASDAMDVDPFDANQPSVVTVPITISAGGSKDSPLEFADKQDGLVVHVPLGSPMQVDGRTNNTDNSGTTTSFTTVTGTMEWAQNVRAEIDGSSPDRNGRTAQSSSSLVPPGQNTSRSSSVGGMSDGTGSNALAPASSTPAPNLLQSVLNHQTTTDHQQQRVRTASVPRLTFTSNIPSLPTTEEGVPMSWPHATSSLHGLDDKSGSMTHVVTNGPSRNQRALPRLRSPFNPSSMSSEGEAPSRSQSPSADEASTAHNASLPPRTAPTSIATHKPPMLDPSLALLNDQSTKTFDYKDPRPLHEVFTPPALTTFEDPIWEVVQDMREQRMSLCQSLRQYVFVHAAIIEGSLMVLDEEREIAAGIGPRNQSRTASPAPPEPATTEITPATPATPVPATPGTPLTPASPASPAKSERAPRSRSRSLSLRHLHSNDTTSGASSPSTGKRGASPTELRKEDKEGGVMLSKRPSIKRKQRSGDDTSVENGRYMAPPSLGVPLVGGPGPSVRSMPP
ncbi:unnamed protein product [Cyclocybe aegerita]|uniref:protein-tyrosine-phosphatase n=1 Tax=Cyclocybe aegerita TaxID=1973307 RepID=A0A8S0W1A8_CYCAE|nr:unnamed protein product [Cyclocybe aegerita]